MPMGDDDLQMCLEQTKRFDAQASKDARDYTNSLSTKCQDATVVNGETWR
jgi:hypothetical protein